MSGRPFDPYATLGVAPDAPDAQVRAAYRQLVQRHHPDHNGGSLESARRFEAVQEAYAEIRRLRQAGGDGATGAGAAHTPPPRGAETAGTAGPEAGPEFDATVDARLAQIQRELHEAQQARERAMRAAREAAAAAAPQRPQRASDEELGYITTDDSFGKIFADAADQLADRLADAKEPPGGRKVSERLGNVVDDLEEIAARLTGEASERRRRRRDDK